MSVNRVILKVAVSVLLLTRTVITLEHTPPIFVDVGMDILSLIFIDEAKEELTIDLFLHQSWQKPHAIITDLDGENFSQVLCNSSQGVFQQQFLQGATSSDGPEWTPDLFFRTLRKAEAVTFPTQNRVLHRFDNGTTQLSSRHIVTFHCKMNFRWIPFDIQTCTIPVQSLSSTTSPDVVLRWSHRGVTLPANLEVPRFMLKQTNASNCDPESSNENSEGIQKYGCLKLQLTLHRPPWFLFVEILAPTTVLIQSSCLGFWIDPAMGPARVSLSTVLMLAGISLYYSTKASVPPFAYFKFIEVWTVSCTTFISLTLVEYAVVNYLMTRSKAAKHEDSSGNGHTLRCRHSRCCAGVLFRGTPVKVNPEMNSRRTGEPIAASQEEEIKRKPLHEMIDYWSRLVFPLMYLFMLGMSIMAMRVFGQGQNQDTASYYTIY